MSIVSCNGQIFNNVQVIFLDKDGTLANVAAYLSQLGRTQAELMEQQLPSTYNPVLKILGFSDHGLTASGLLAVGSRHETIIGTAAAAAMVGYPWIQAVEVATSTLETADHQCSPKAAYTPLLPGVLDFLKRLKQTELKVIMVSADTQSNLKNFVDYYGLQPYFDNLQGVSSQHPSKVAPSFLQTACKSLDISPQHGVVIGDAASDLRMAASAKGFIGFLGGWSPYISQTDIIHGHDLNSNDLPRHAFTKDFSQIRLG
ncbi:HAD family hydrolase [Leptothoe spongobia]|uniref:HAD-IA family hydrolase n=1 Tax=Leptothoe spongobia TAU-MAC 1115 TaxID=1967444 RepID=A0A947GJG5_9CYAN|nr:HAD family hydrolase [Leptothoe spongobia]MBT9316539.1 HAD-IA family hydrolase [Leptothoe spongobia TAU-MAC 1115]